MIQVPRSLLTWQVFPISKAQEALQVVADREAIGKVVVRVREVSKL